MRSCIYETPRFASLKGFVGYLGAKSRAARDELTYRLYVTDVLKMLCEGLAPDRRYGEILLSKEKEATAEEIIAGLERGGIHMRSEDESS